MPSQVLAKKVLELRSRRGSTQDELAQRMTRLGIRWTRSTVAKIEHGDRQVTIDELICLARALNAQPAALLTDDAEQQSLTPTTKLSPREFWHWMTGFIPPFYDPSVKPPIADTYAPAFAQLADTRLPGMANVVSHVAELQSVAGGSAGDPATLLDAISQTLAALETEVRLLRERVDAYSGDDSWLRSHEGRQR